MEVSHEALIREWPALQEWLTDNREDLHLGRILMEAAEEWRRLERHPSALMRGIRLEQARQWVAMRGDTPPLLGEYFSASCRAEEMAVTEEREAQERELARQEELRQQAAARAEAEERLRQEAERRRAAEEVAAVQARRSKVRGRRLWYAAGVLLLIAGLAAMLLRYFLEFAKGEFQLAALTSAQNERRMAAERSQEFSLALRSWRTAKTPRTNLVVARAFPELLVKFDALTGRIWQIALSPDGQRIVTASDDHTARVWSAANGQLLVNLEGHTASVGDAEFSPDGQRIVTASDDGTARVWNAVNGQLLVKLKGHTGWVVHAAFSPNGQRIVTASWDHRARVWNAASGQPLATLVGHTDKVRQAVFSPDGQRIVTASWDHTARIYRVVTLSDLAELLGK